MSLIRKMIAPAGLLLAALGLAGCPAAPSLSVTPAAVVINADQNASEIQIRNLGGGTLNWTASESLSWLTLQEAIPGADKQAGTLSGSITTNVAALRLVVSRGAADSGNLSGEITVTSNGGTANVRVTAIVTTPAELEVSTNTLTFGATANTVQFTVKNRGAGTVNWSLDIPYADGEAEWLEATPTSGTLTAGGAETTITATVDREDLPAGSFTKDIVITSPSGSQNVTASILVPPLEVRPSLLDFGVVFGTGQQSLALYNKTFNALAYTVDISTNNGGNWLSAPASPPAIPAKGNLALTLTANADGLAPATYSGQVTIQLADASYQVTVPVSMTVTAFSVNTDLLDLGTVATTTTRTVVLTDSGSVPIAWTAAVPASDAAWLSVSPDSDVVPANSSQNVTVTVNPLAVAPGNYESTVTFQYPGGSSVVTVRFNRPLPASLTVEPQNVNFQFGNDPQLVGIWNPGIGSVNWTIDTTSFPAWLSLTPMNGAGIASGTVSGDITQSITLRANRALLPSGATQFSHAFDVVASGDATNTVRVNVSIGVPQNPKLVVVAPTDDNGVNFLNISEDEDSDTFIIRNEGTAALSWNFDTSNSAQPVWIASIQPAQGNLEPNTQQTITVTVDRTTLNFLGGKVTMNILSNDPLDRSHPFIFEVLVPKRVAIATLPGAFAFGTNQSSDILDVANSGDPDTVMLFRLRPTKNWLDIYPRTGSSTGTTSTIKDFKSFAISVDRSLLDEAGASASIIIEAIDTDGTVIEDVTPVEVTVTVQAAQLTMETQPLAFLRPPSVVRMPMIMRNIRYQVIELDEAILPQIESQFQILVNDTPLEASETAQRLKLGFGERGEFAGSALIMLDYSGSMLAAAENSDDPAIANAADPLQELYERTINQLLDSLPADIRVGIGIFSDRDPQLRLPLNFLFGSATEPLEQQDEIFILDRTALKNRLANVVVNDHGATQLLQAVEQAVNTIRTLDFDRGKYLSDQTELPALICVTDGRITTPPTPVPATVTYLQDNRIRFYPIGWGQGVASGPLVQLAENSGGHYYSTRTNPTGIFDTFGTELRQPIVNELENWCVTEADPCDQSVGRDFASLVTLSFVSLNEEPGALIKARLTFDDPTDQGSPCVPEQGDISGSVTELPADLDIYVAENRLGQISLRSTQINPDGTARVTFRLEYAPRNVSGLTFRLGVVGANAIQRNNVRVATAPNDGVISDWILGGAGDTFIFTATADPLPFGDNGDLFTVDLTGATDGALLLVEMTDPVITASPESKFFTYPDSIELSASQSIFASALPTPELTTNPPFEYGRTRVLNNLNGNGNDPAFSEVDARVLDLGTDVTDYTLFVRNIGGNHFVSRVRLLWEISAAGEFPDSVGLPVQQDLKEGILNSTLEVDTVDCKVDRTLEPGQYTAIIKLDFGYDAIRLGSTMPPLIVKWQVLPSLMDVTPTTLDFGTTTDELSFTVSNTSQSFVSWSVQDVDALPDWLLLLTTAGFVSGGTSSDVAVSVNRANLAAGTYQTTFRVVNEAVPSQFQDIEVIMTVPPAP